MNRRALLEGLVALAFLPAPSIARSQSTGRVFLIGVVFNSVPLVGLAGPTPTDPNARSILDGLRDEGWVEGKNIKVHWRSAEDRYERRPAIIEELVRMPVDVLMISGNIAAKEAVQKTRSTPIVATMTAPVEDKLVESISRPGGNVTGIAVDTGTEINSKRLALLKQAAPTITRVAFLFPPYAPLESALELAPPTIAAARALGLSVFPQKFEAIEKIDSAVEGAVRQGANAIYVGDWQPFFRKENQIRIHRAAESHRLPAVYYYPGSSESGGLITYSVDHQGTYRRAGAVVAKILKGGKPGAIPIEQPTKFELVINLKATKAIGLTIPQSVLLQADRVIE